MSMYVHRCARCGHMQQWHTLGECSYGMCSYGMCPCDVNTATFSPPELIPTFDGVTALENPAVLPPGASLALGFHACSCPECAAAVGGAA